MILQSSLNNVSVIEWFINCAISYVMLLQLFLRKNAIVTRTLNCKKNDNFDGVLCINLFSRHTP